MPTKVTTTLFIPNPHVHFNIHLKPTASKYLSYAEDKIRKEERSESTSDNYLKT